jgi:hypothetical protein
MIDGLSLTLSQGSRVVVKTRSHLKDRMVYRPFANEPPLNLVIDVMRYHEPYIYIEWLDGAW